MALLLVDLDLALVMNAAGEECRAGDRVYRTAPSFDFVVPRGVQVVVLTQRSRPAAEELLSASGFRKADALVTASELLREAVRQCLVGRLRGLGKDTAGPLLRRRHGWTNASSTVLVDDRAFNLTRMILAGLVRWGIRVPEVKVAAGEVTSFDGGSLLGWAAELARGSHPSSTRIPKDVRWNRVGADGRLVPVEEPVQETAAGFMADFPGSEVCWPLGMLETSHRFSGGRTDLVSLLRLVKHRVLRL